MQSNGREVEVKKGATKRRQSSVQDAPYTSVRTGSATLPYINLSDSPNTSRRNTPTFLDGVAIPNSVVRASMCSQEEQEALENKRRSTALELERILRQFMPKEEDAEDGNLLLRIQKELERRKLVNKVAKVSKNIDEQKELRRISRRTSRLEPLACGRRSTCESIHRSIQQSELIRNLITDEFLRQSVTVSEDEREEKLKKDGSVKSIESTLTQPIAKKLARIKGSKKSRDKVEVPSAVKPAPISLSVKAGEDFQLLPDQIDNTQPWTAYILPKVEKSHESLKEDNSSQNKEFPALTDLGKTLAMKSTHLQAPKQSSIDKMMQVKPSAELTRPKVNIGVEMKQKPGYPQSTEGKHNYKPPTPKANHGLKTHLKK